MKIVTLTLLAATATGAVAIGSASAVPRNTASPGLGTSLVQDVRVVCDQYGQCYNTRRSNRTVRPLYGPRYDVEPGYYASRGYGYYDGPRVGIGIGPFGIGAW